MKKILTASAVMLVLAVSITGCTFDETDTDKPEPSATENLSKVSGPPTLTEAITSINGWKVDTAIDPAITANQTAIFSNASDTCQVFVNSQLLSPANLKEKNDAKLTDAAVEAFIFPATLDEIVTDRKIATIKNTEGGGLDFIRATYAPTTYHDFDNSEGISNYDAPKKGIITARVFNQQFVVERDGTVDTELEKYDEPDRPTAPDIYTETVRPQITMTYLCDESSFSEDEYQSILDSMTVSIPFEASKLEI